MTTRTYMLLVHGSRLSAHFRFASIMLHAVFSIKTIASYHPSPGLLFISCSTRTTHYWKLSHVLHVASLVRQSPYDSPDQSPLSELRIWLRSGRIASTPNKLVHRFPKDETNFLILATVVLQFSWLEVYLPLDYRLQ
jgi:hypothetical protein